MNSFKYQQPKSLQDAGKFLLQNKGLSLPFAGGTDVLGLIKNNIEKPENLVNLKLIKGLGNITYIAGKELRIGALVKLFEIAEHPVVKKNFTVLAQAVKETASPQFRNIATLGGNLCQRPRCFYFRGDFHCLRKGGDICYAVDGQNKYHCIVGGGPCYIVHPSDSAVALLALNAQVSIYSNGKSRTIPLKDFFILPAVNHTKENILKQGEILEEIIIPEPPNGSKSEYIKFKERAVWDFAVVSVAAVVKKSGDRIENGSVAFGGVAPVPWRIDELNKKLKGLSIKEEDLETFSKLFFKNAFALEKNGYKIPLARNLMKRILINLTV